MELGVLGPLRVRQFGLPVAIPGAKPRSVLTVLGLYGGAVVPGDTLVELLWGADPPRTAAKALQTHISALRRVLGDGFVLTQGTGWTLNDAEIDAVRYTTAVGLGRGAMAAGDAGRAVTCFDEALALWRGAPELPAGRRGDTVRTRWVEGHAAVIEDRADALLASGRAAELIGELEAAIADAPLRERRWGQLMLALYRAGRQSEALGAYRRVRSLLADELGVDPGPDLRRLESRIVTQDVGLELPAAQHVSSVTRAVTFLLTDIEGSTAAWEADAEAMAGALARHDEIVEQVVTFRGGRLIKTRGEGDATFSVFDRPSAAVAAALELQQAVGREPWGLAEPMRIRIALHTGEVEFRDGDYFGRAVNRAARLRSLAAGGQTLCSGATAELVIDTLADDVELVDLGLRQLKNLARAERVFELRLSVPGDGRSPTVDTPIETPALPAVLAGPGPFVGRESELERLAVGWQATLVAGARATLIAGEPGVGKTRLAGEWCRLAHEQGAIVLYGRCDEDLGAPYQPFTEALRSLVPCMGAERLRGLRGVEALIPLVPGLNDELPELAAPTRADPDTERYALFDAVVAMLGAASASAPVVLVLDDLHWAAKPTLLLLRHLLRFGEHAHVQVVGTYRSTDLDRSHPLAAMLADLNRDGSADRLQLAGLDEAEVTSYVAAAGYDDDLARALAAVTGGNPFFLIEALRHVEESGGRWDPSTLPQGVREAVTRRLSRLSAESNKALSAAAVVGSRFAVDLVERVAGEDLVDAFDEACRAGIVIEEPGGWYRFNHALVRQSLLAELASVRRMRLHQRIAAALEESATADDELLAELAYHYFECAWAGNAAKAVDYCGRAADQAMSRLSYEGAAELYDKALHALEELDDELPERDVLQAELLIARCEALLAAGDVASATGAVAQLRSVAGDSGGRLSAWGVCFAGQLSVLTDPERLDEIAAEVSAAAEELARLDDAAGEAKAHTVRATCLGRLGRIGDCESALDHALTAARRAHEHRRVNAVLANAPLAALWGPNPVPRAGGRCLDVVRLLRITTGSPVVEATSTRCQGVLDAFRGRAGAGRQLIESARRSLSELGIRHALLEVEQFAGIVELVVDDAAAAEIHLRKAYNGFRRIGLDADTADTAALLARACLALGNDEDADRLCSESERLAGHALKPAIAWRTVRAQLLAREGDHAAAKRVAEEAVAIAARTDALVDHGDACLALAVVLSVAGDVAGSRAAAARAAQLYDLKGAAALVENARALMSEPVAATSPSVPKPISAEPENACTRVVARVDDAWEREAWDELERLLAPTVFVDNRRRIVGLTRGEWTSEQWITEARQVRESGFVRYRRETVAVRGESLALTKDHLATADSSSGAPQIVILMVNGIDEHGRLSLHMSFDAEDLDVALAELDARDPASDPRNACARVIADMVDAWDGERWAELESHLAPAVVMEDRRKIVGFSKREVSSAQWVGEVARYRKSGKMRYHSSVAAVRGDRLVLARLEVRTEDVSTGAPQDEMLVLYGIDEQGRIALQLVFDIDDVDAAAAELDARYAAREVRPANAASRIDAEFQQAFSSRDWPAMETLLDEDFVAEDRRRVVNAGIRSGRDAKLADMRATAEIGARSAASTVLAVRGQRLALVHIRLSGRDDRPSAFQTEMLGVVESNPQNRMVVRILFDIDDFAAALAELDARYLAGESAPDARTYRAVTRVIESLSNREMPYTTEDFVDVDHRAIAGMQDREPTAYLGVAITDSTDIRLYIESVHRLTDTGTVITHVTRSPALQGTDAEWRVVAVVTFDGGLPNRCEIYDESDLDTALARFEELCRAVRPLGNGVTAVADRLYACFAARDWCGLSQILAEDVVMDDRRRVVGAGVRRGRDAEIADLRALAEIGMAQFRANVVATRGERLALSRFQTWQADGQPDEFHAELLGIGEVDGHGRVTAIVGFDADDLDAAFAELDARYSAGEAAPHAHVWSVISSATAAFNRGDAVAVTSDCVVIDHRVKATIASGSDSDLDAYLNASWNLTPDLRAHIETVHALTGRGAVVTTVSSGTTADGFRAEWRQITMMTVRGDVGARCEIFDEADLCVALARFDELNQQIPRPTNATVGIVERLWERFEARDWEAVGDLLSDGTVADDRRRVTGSIVLRGRDANINHYRALAGVGAQRVTTNVIATRGQRLALGHFSFSGDGHTGNDFYAEALAVVETDDAQRIAARVIFDPDDVDAAYTELDARYTAGDAAPHADTWTAIANANASFNRREMPATTPDWVNVDHRRGGMAFAPGQQTAYMRATWAIAGQVVNRIVTVHRLEGRGVAFTQFVRASSDSGFTGEWRDIVVMTFAGDKIDHCEVYDEADLDAALARFDELAATPTLSNRTVRLALSAADAVNRRSVADYLTLCAADARFDDRRSGLLSSGPLDAVFAEALIFNAPEGWRVEGDPVAVRGDRLALIHYRYRDLVDAERPIVVEALGVLEVGAAGSLVLFVLFDADARDAAFAELDARFLAGEAAPHGHAWTVIVNTTAAFDQHGTPAATTNDCVTVDHRRMTAFAPGEFFRYVRATADVVPDMNRTIEAVHRLSDRGAVVTGVANGSTKAGFSAQWRVVVLGMIDGDSVNRYELFDEADLDAALARFDELA
ncbi:hypothetical protein MPNTM1_02001 [Mycolicibacterium parafortuitum]|uniref:BTAD domain-containing putative transcriptional regulator n=1 Tax=Mycolicibacterium parafortuitum TaxID=39692 RepID=UPI003A706D1E